VFIGIETPNEESLRETKKLQNVRTRGGTLLEKVRHIQQSGLEVWSGMIVGFDHDTSDIFDAQARFLSEARIVHAMVGMLYAIPKTPLYVRLAAVGRLDGSDSSEFGTNVVPLKMSREALSDGYVRLMRELYEPNAYFDRVDSLYLDTTFAPGEMQRQYLRRHPLQRVKAQAWNAVRGCVVYWRLMRRVNDVRLQKVYRERLRNLWRVRRDPYYFFVYALKCALHYHCHRILERMTQPERVVVNSF
jgi:radical SAM superfamily enzyme YgiQ (UPF0313 family)